MPPLVITYTWARGPRTLSYNLRRLTRKLERRGVLLTSYGRCNATSACDRDRLMSEYRARVEATGHAVDKRGVRRCMGALDRVAERTRVYSDFGSLTLRRLVAHGLPDGTDTYVANGDFIAAALLRGYRGRFVDAERIDAQFRMSLE